MAAPPRVFLSYARKDGELIANQIRRPLESEHPELELWQDLVKLRAGAGWFGQLIEAIEQSQYLAFWAELFPGAGVLGRARSGPFGSHIGAWYEKIAPECVGGAKFSVYSVGAGRAKWKSQPRELQGSRMMYNFGKPGDQNYRSPGWKRTSSRGQAPLGVAVATWERFEAAT